MKKGIIAATWMAMVGVGSAVDACEVSLETYQSAYNFSAKQYSINTLIDCLASKHPALRDEFAFTELSSRLRDNTFAPDELVDYFNQVTSSILSDKQTTYHRSFLTLALSELARVDRKSPYLNQSQREQLVNIAVKLFSQTTDFTGFNEEVGYVHQIPHTADLVLQLALNPGIDKQQIIELSKSLAKVINPTPIHFYHYNEPDRLVRASVYLMMRSELKESYWQQWLGHLSTYKKGDWNRAYEDNEGLAAMHNTQSYLNRLLLWTYNAKNERLAKIHQQTLELLKKVR